MLLLWNNIRFQNEPPNPNQLTKEPVPRDLIEDGISNGKSACGKVSRVRHMVPGESRKSLPERKVRFADNTEN
jgi:hypothetical protein